MDKFLKNMRINISEKELKDLTQSLPVSGEHLPTDQHQKGEAVKGQTLEPLPDLHPGSSM